MRENHRRRRIVAMFDRMARIDSGKSSNDREGAVTNNVHGLPYPVAVAIIDDDIVIAARSAHDGQALNRHGPLVTHAKPPTIGFGGYDGH
jgi:hypothetical protein